MKNVFVRIFSIVFSLLFLSYSSEDIDALFRQLVNITPVITGKRVSVGGETSAQALTDIQTLIVNGNTVTIFNCSL